MGGTDARTWPRREGDPKKCTLAEKKKKKRKKKKKWAGCSGHRPLARALSGRSGTLLAVTALTLRQVSVIDEVSARMQECVACARSGAAS